MRLTSRPYLLSAVLLLILLLLSVAIGNAFIPLSTILQLVAARFQHAVPAAGPLAPLDAILFDLRLPRTVMVTLVGAALSGSGAAYQGLFRNPLADPYLIGIASGAGLGAVLAMSIHWPYSWLGLLAVPLSAFIAAILTVTVVYQMARVRQTLPTANLILAGVAVSAFATAITSMLMLLSNDELHRALAWLLGGSTLSGWKPVLAMLPYILVGMGILLTTGHALNVLQFGDEQAQQLGLPVERVRRMIIAAASLATAAAVSFAGIIGFIGLVVPHVVRLVWGVDHRRLLPLAMINGASLLLAADILARTLMAPQELPVGIITALGGAPFFLWVLRRTKQQLFW